MLVVIFISIIALLLTLSESLGLYKHGMKLCFILVATLGAIHYDYGNDYLVYLSFYESFVNKPFDFSRIISGEYFAEPGWVLLNYPFKYIGGFFTLVAFLNIIQNIIIYRFIRKYVAKSWYPLAVFTYLFTTSYYLLSFSMMRQMLVIVIFLGLWRFISQKKWVKALIILLLSTTIHSSAVILLPFAFWGYLPIKRSKLLGVLYALFLLVLWTFGDVLNDTFNLLSNIESLHHYSTTYGNSDATMKLGVGFYIQLIPFFLCIYFLLKNSINSNDSQKKMVALAAIHAIITPFGQIIPIVSRIGFYFGVYRFGSFPLIYGNLTNKVIRNVLLLLNVLITLYDYFLFFSLETWVDKYSEFHTIFSVI